MTQQNTNDDIITGYYELLNGKLNGFDKETIRRVNDFAKEFETKREYDKFTTFDSSGDDMIIANHLRLFSFCEHHLLPFFGEVSIGYIPNDLIFGLSKFQRLVDKIASKPQVQERITHEILKSIQRRLKPLGVGVVVRAIHTCVFARGVQSASAEFTTNAMSGRFRENDSTRAEFLSCISDSRLRI